MMTRTLAPINESDPFRQLNLFFAAFKRGEAPVVLHARMPQEQREAIAAATVADGAEFAVLSSGSTGAPRLQFRTWESWARYFPEQNKLFGIGPGSRVYFNGSMSFTGNLNLCAGALAAGAELVTSPGLSGRRMREQIDETDADVVYMVPSKLALLARASRGLALNKRVKWIVTGSQILRPEVYDGLRAAFPAALIVMYYGASEAGYISYIEGDEIRENPGCLGRPFPGVAFTTGADGRILVTTAGGVLGAQMPFEMPDLGRVDAKGRLWLTGRSDEAVNIGGYKVNLAYVREVLLKLPLVTDAAVLYTDAGRARARIVAFAVCEGAPGLFEDEILYKLEKRLLPVEVPRRIILLPRIPLNEGGKPDRAALEDLLLSAGPQK
ncbi:MAG: AMP-binding protein [Clostridiales Family XIII bacterium]|nr:AMP-binding protein [Clostridiales Family XIII bacterium]